MTGITEVSLSDFNEQTVRTNFGIGRRIAAYHEKKKEKKEREAHAQDERNYKVDYHSNTRPQNKPRLDSTDIPAVTKIKKSTVNYDRRKSSRAANPAQTLASTRKIKKH